MIMHENELSCKEVVELITDYLEEKLVIELQSKMQNHLTDCPGCKAYLQQIQQTISLLRGLGKQPDLLNTRQALLQYFRTQIPRQ